MGGSWEHNDPNSQNQLWSRWTLIVHGRHIPMTELKINAARWLRKMFGSTGRARVDEITVGVALGVRIQAEVEGAPVNDPDYVERAREEFKKFIKLGWGEVAIHDLKVEIIAGNAEDGKPRRQLVVLPSIPVIQ